MRGQYTFAPQLCRMSNACVSGLANVFEHIIQANILSRMNCSYEVKKRVLLNEQPLQSAVNAEILFAYIGWEFVVKVCGHGRINVVNDIHRRPKLMPNKPV